MALSFLSLSFTHIFSYYLYTFSHSLSLVRPFTDHDYKLSLFFPPLREKSFPSPTHTHTKNAPNFLSHAFRMYMCMFVSSVPRVILIVRIGGARRLEKTWTINFSDREFDSLRYTRNFLLNSRCEFKYFTYSRRDEVLDF